MEPVDRTDGELLGEFVDVGCHAAFDALVRRHHAMVAGVCRRMSGGLHDADDAAQAVFIALASKADELRDRRSVAGWLHRAAWHLSLRARRDAAARRRLESTGARPSGNGTGEADDAALAGALGAEARRELDRALGMLPEDYREALVLHHLEGMTVAQVAGLLGCPPGTVAARLSRGRSLLRERLRWRGLVLVATSGALSAAFADVARATEAAEPVAALGGADASWGADGCAAAPAVPSRLATLPAAPTHWGGYGAVAGGAVAPSAAAAPPAAAVAGFGPAAWATAVASRVTVALAVGVGTIASAAAGYHVWVESRPSAAASFAGSNARSGAGSSLWGLIPAPVPAPTPVPKQRSRPADDDSRWDQRVFIVSRNRSGGPAGVVPEPSALALLAVGGLALLRRRR